MNEADSKGFRSLECAAKKKRPGLSGRFREKERETALAGFLHSVRIERHQR